MSNLKLRTIPKKYENYQLKPNKYVIDISDELLTQLDIMPQIIHCGLATMKDFYEWLENNNFSSILPDMTNEFVSQYYGREVLWSSDYSTGIVVKSKDDDDYYIVMELSNKFKGLEHVQVILTLLDVCKLSMSYEY